MYHPMCSPCTAGAGGLPCGRVAVGSLYDLTQCLACWRWVHHAARLADGSLSPDCQRPLAVEVPCVHLGGEKRRVVAQARGGHPGNVRLRACEVYGECHPTRRIEGVAYCPTCQVRRPNTHTLVAPLGTRGRPGQWQGRLPRKPWSYRVSACIPHLETPECLEVVVETLRWQTVSPYIIVVDTGSTPAVCERIEQLRSEDVEIHYLRANGWMHPSQPVTAALDLAHTVCHTEYLYHTHADAFARRPDWLEWLLVRCNASCPVVGYEMSERSGTDEWRGTVSHTATMLHMPTMRAIGATWSMKRWWEATGRLPAIQGSWPDTEAMMRVCLDRAGITPLFVDDVTCPGARHEQNYTRDVDVNVDHVRSYPSHLLYRGPVGTHAAEWMLSAMAEARQRVADWKFQAATVGQKLSEIG